MLFINRWFLSLLVALVVLDGGVQAFRYYKRMGNRFRPVIMKPMPVGRFGFVRAENPNADGAMDAKSGEESSDVAPQAPAMDGLPMHDMHEPQMREMIHDSPHPVEIDMGPEMQSRVMGFEGELDEGNFGRAAGDEGEDKEEEEGGQFRHFKHKKHKKHKYVIHTHHHYHHKKGGEGYGHHGYGHGHHGGYGHGHHGGYGGHHHGGGGHGYGHGDEGDEGDDYEPTYGHHGRYRRSSSMSESSPAQELASDGGPQALDRTVLHSSPDHPIPLVAVATTDPGTPGSPAYRQSVSRRQLVRSKNERLARIGRDRAQRANSPNESNVRAVRNLIFDRYNPRMMEPYGGMRPTGNTNDRRRQRQDLRRRLQDKPQTRPLDAFKNAISSIRQRVMPTTTTPVPTTVARKRGQRPARSRRTKNASGMVAAPLAPSSPPPPPPPPPAPINCAECRRLCNARGRARARPLEAAQRRRAGADTMVASGTPGEEGLVASPAAAAAPGAPIGNMFNSFMDIFGPQDGFVASAGPDGGDGSNVMQRIANFFAFPEDGMVSSTKDGEGQGWNIWNLFAPESVAHDDRVSATRKFTDESLPYCEDIMG